MKKTLFLTFVLSTFLFSFLSAQDQIVVTKPHLEFKDNNIIVIYSILNSDDDQSFRIWMDVSDESGNAIAAKALSGDIGSNVEGGNDKKIYWNLTADNLYLDTELSIKINAEILAKAEAHSERVTRVPMTFKEYTGSSRGGLYVQSLIFPGWGMSRVGKGPHWLKGVAAYGSLVTSFVYNNMAKNNYRDYINTSDVIEGNRLFALSNKQDKISEGLAIAGAAIWVTDMIWTIAGTQQIKNGLSAAGIRIEPGFEKICDAPVIALKYSF